MYRRKGISTILGTLIFIGILFSAIVPMVLVMNQANIIYTQKLHETEIKDNEKVDELVYVYAYPDEETDKISVKVHNEEETPVQIVRVWINNDNNTVSITVNPKTTTTIGEFDASLQDETYIIKVTTSNGNVFRGNDGAIYYSGGVWLIPDMGVTVNILNNKNSQYNITITNTTDTQWKIEYLTGPINNDVIQTFILGRDLSYIVCVGKKVGNDWVNLPGTPVTIELIWPGEPLIQIFVSGYDT